MVNSLRTADVSPRSSLLRDVETSLSGDERRETSAIRTLHGWSLGCLAVYKSGSGTRGRGHRDACVGTWDLGTRDEGIEDIKYGTRGRVGRERGDVKYRDAGDAGCE